MHHLSSAPRTRAGRKGGKFTSKLPTFSLRKGERNHLRGSDDARALSRLVPFPPFASSLPPPSPEQDARGVARGGTTLTPPPAGLRLSIGRPPTPPANQRRSREKPPAPPLSLQASLSVKAAKAGLQARPANQKRETEGEALLIG